MPTYEYKCEACGHAFEKFQSMSSKPVRKCPECGKNAVKRLIGTGAGLIFKGSGFYITDYRSEGYKDKAKADSGASSAASSSTSESKPDSAASSTPAAPKAETKTEAKPAAPAAKAETKPSKASNSASKSSKK
jgi:putative FmdB family regulatory protein